MTEDNIIKTKTYILKELNYLNNWLKFRNPKKITIRANDLFDEYKLLKSSDSSVLREKVGEHLLNKVSMLKKIIDDKIDNINVFNDFIKIVKKEFNDNSVIMKNIDETVKLHKQYINDLEKGKDIIAKI
jgi:hypothetical protein